MIRFGQSAIAPARTLRSRGQSVVSPGFPRARQPRKMDETGDIAVAWDRKTGLEKEEWRLRTRAPGQGILNDTVTAQWLESSKRWDRCGSARLLSTSCDHVRCCCRDFSAAWAHASAIGADIRRTYAEMLTSPHSPQVIKKVLSALTLDVLALLATMRSHEGPNPMADAVGAIEGALRIRVAHRRPVFPASCRKALRHAPCRCSRSLHGPLLSSAPSL